ncbi:hypothetical protein ACWGS9_24455 [Bradyrhizobium sp. Arg314]
MEVVIFPAAPRGTGEGDRDWDLQPDSRMTNGTVADVTEIESRTVTLTYDNGQKRQNAIPRTYPIVTFATATPADLAPGVAVFVNAERDGGGKLVTNRVVVGNHGIAPPLGRPEEQDQARSLIAASGMEMAAATCRRHFYIESEKISAG